MNVEFVTVSRMEEILNKFYDEKLSFLEDTLKENKELKSKIKVLESKLDDLSSYTRRNNIVVHGAPIQENEDPINLAVKVSDAVGVKLEEKDIDIAHRLPSRNNNFAPPFIIKLVNRFKKEEVMSNAKRKKIMAKEFNGEEKCQIFFNDHLTKKNQEILMKAKSLWADYFIWTKNGHVLGRAKEGGRIFQIKLVEEIDYWKNTGNGSNQSTNGNKKRTADERSPQNENIGRRRAKKTDSHLNQFQFNKATGKN